MSFSPCPSATEPTRRYRLPRLGTAISSTTSSPAREGTKIHDVIKMLSRDGGGDHRRTDVAIDARGVITGQFCNATTCHGYLRYPGGDFVTFDPPGAQYTNPIEGNRAGAVTGVYCDATACHGFLRAPSGAYVEFEYPVAINSVGAVTGQFCDATAYHGSARPRGRGSLVEIFVDEVAGIAKARGAW